MTQEISCTAQSLNTENPDVFSPFEVKSLPLAATLTVHSDLPVSCISSSLHLIIADDNRVSIFKEDTFEVIWEISADHPVSISLSDDSRLLLVAENAGLLQLYHIPTKECLWSHVFKKNSQPLSLTQSYISIDYSGSLKLYVFTKEHVAFEFSNMSVSTLYGAIGDGNFEREIESLNEVFDTAILEEIDMSTLNPECQETNSFKMFCSLQSVGLITQCCSLITPNIEYYDVENLFEGVIEADVDWNPHKKSIFQCYDFSSYGHIIKASHTRDGRYIIFLNDEHVLSVMCSFTQTVLKTLVRNESEGHIESFVINETVDPSSFSVIEQKIGLLIKTTTAGRISYVFEICKFPSFELIGSISLAQYVQLIECKPNQDFWYVLDGELIEDSGGKPNSHLNLKVIFESLPEARLTNLVNKRKFSEAVKLAEISNLSSEVIHKTKIKCILDNLLVNKYKNESKADLDLVWDELEVSFKHIQDVEFIRSCLLYSLPEGSYMERLLLFLKNWVILNSYGNDVKNIISQVNQILNKLVTHDVLSSILDSCIALKDFLNMNLLNYMITELKAENPNTAFIVWKRHKDEFFQYLNSETLSQIISSISDSMPSQLLIPFLCDDFLPSVLMLNPDIIDMFANWLIQRVHLIEVYEKDLWQENSLKLVTTFLKVIHNLEEKDRTGEMSFTTNLSWAAIHKKFVDMESFLGCMSELSRDLTWLISLKSKFNCKISLADCQESKMNVIFAVLDRVDLKVIPNAIENFARPYCLENRLDLEICLEQYIKHTLQTSCFTWWFWNEDPWEERLIAVTNAIHCTDKWVSAALWVASRAKVPWSQGINELVEKGARCDHPRKTSFEKESKLVGLKEVLLKYDMKSFPIKDDVILIYALVNYIFKQNKDSAFQDAKKVLLSVHDYAVDSDVLFMCLQYACNHNKLEEVSEILSTLPHDAAVKCAKRLLIYFQMYLNDITLINHQKNCVQNMLHSGLYLIEYLQKFKEPINEDLQSPFKSLLKLQEEFNIYMTFSDISSKTQCKMVINSAINDFLENKNLPKTADTYLRKHKPVPSSSFSRLLRLGDILSFEREEIMGFLITSCLQKQKYDLVLKLCQELTVSCPSQNTAESLMQVVRHFFLNFKTIKDENFSVMVDTICHLNNVAVNYCKKESLVRCLKVVKLSTYISTLKEISGIHSLSMIPEFTADLYHKWKFYPVYQDEGFQLDCELVTDFTVKLYHNTVKGSVLEQVTLESCFNSIVEHMKERGQGLAALRTIFMYYHITNKTVEVLVPALDLAPKYFPKLKLIENITFATVQRAINQRKVDLYFTYNLLGILQESFQLLSIKALLKWCSSDLSRLALVGKLGMEVANSCQDTSIFTKYENIYKKASLLSRLSVKSVPSLNVIFDSSKSGTIWAVIEDLIISQNITVPILQEFCNAFQLTTDHALIAYLNSILTESEKLLAFEEYDKEVISALKKAEFVIGYIADEELLCKNFLHLLKKVSPYSYEVLLFIEEQLIHASANIQTFNIRSAEKEVSLLKFLQVYDRISPLDELEISRWKDLHPLDTKPPAISNKRLPFHCFLEDYSHKIINPELTVNTLPVWVKISPVLEIPVDDLVIIAVKNSVVTYLSQQSAPHILLNTDTRFTSNINAMIERITVPEKSAYCASWVTNTMPPGGNKVYFANMTLKFAKKSYEQGASSQNAIEMYKRFLCLSQQFAVERVLYSNNLYSDAVSALVHSSPKLIDYLIGTCSLNVNECVKACKAVFEIGDITNIDTADIILGFILRWSKITRSTVANMDETFSEDASTSNEFEDTDSENVLRIINLLISLPHSKYSDIFPMFKLKFPDLTGGQKARLVFCMVSVFNVRVVSAELEVNAQQIEENLVPMMCSVELEKLNMSYSLTMFANCNKTELIQRILSNSDSSKVVIFCIRLCLEYDIWDTSIWEVILRRMVTKPMDYALQGILQSTQAYLKHLWHSEAFVAAWKCVIQNILQMRSTHISVLLTKLYTAIMRCPCVTSLDTSFITSELKYIMQTFDERNVPELDSISDVSSFILNLKKMVNCYSSKVEN